MSPLALPNQDPVTASTRSSRRTLSSTRCESYVAADSSRCTVSRTSLGPAASGRRHAQIIGILGAECPSSRRFGLLVYKYAAPCDAALITFSPEDAHESSPTRDAPRCSRYRSRQWLGIGIRDG